MKPAIILYPVLHNVNHVIRLHGMDFHTMNPHFTIT
jgi:hypothetical protein